MRSKLFMSISTLGLILGSCLDTDNFSAYQQLQVDIAKIDAYLTNNPPDPEDILIKDAFSGIRMVITEQPESNEDSIPPTAQNILEVEYTGKLFSNGTEFETAEKIFTITTDDADGADVIEGWKFALSMMTEGTKATVYIPSGLAYGSKGNTNTSPRIPNNAILVFDLYLKTIDTSDEEPQLTTDKSKIALFLDEEEDVVVHPSGISYTVQLEGTGAIPTLYDQVTIRYTGKVLGGSVFADNRIGEATNAFSSRAVNYIHGLIIGLQLMKKGGKATFYIPSALAYGPEGTENIPENSVLIFEVELLDVIPNIE